MYATKSPAFTRYKKRFFPATALYLAAVMLATWTIPDDAKATPLTVGIALLPGIAIVGMIWAMGRLLVELDDEYLRMLEVQKALIATGLILAISATWGLLELYTDVPKMPVFLIFPAWCLGLGIGQIWQKVRGA